MKKKIMKAFYVSLILLIILTISIIFNKKKSFPTTEESIYSWDEVFNDDNIDKEIILSAPEVDEDGNNIDNNVIVKDIETHMDYFEEYKSQGINRNSTPEECLKKWFYNFKTCDIEQVAKLSAGVYVFPDITENDSIMSCILDRLNWKIINRSIKEDSSTFEVKIIVPDVKSKIKEYINISLSEKEDPELENQITKDINKIARTAKLKSEVLEIELIKEESEWKIVVTDELLNIVSGGLSELYIELLIQYLEGV